MVTIFGDLGHFLATNKRIFTAQTAVHNMRQSCHFFLQFFRRKYFNIITLTLMDFDT
jgi:hypothetical protein